MFPLAFVACVALDHVAPVEVIVDTTPAVVPLVDITAIKALPVTGVVVNVTVKELAVDPVVPVALCTLV